MRGTTYYYQNNKGAAWDDGITAGETAARLGQLRWARVRNVVASDPVNRFFGGINGLAWVQIDILADRADWVAAIEACEARLDLSRHRLGGQIPRDIAMSTPHF